MRILFEKLEGLFVVERKETTYKKAVIGLIFVIIAGFSPYLYIRYEEYQYGKYKAEFDFVVEVVESYRAENNEYPLGHRIHWDNEKDLKQFFVENKWRLNRELYYIDTNAMEDLKNIKYTYIVDPETEQIYTSEFVIAHFKRWHFAFY